MTKYWFKILIVNLTILILFFADYLLKQLALYFPAKSGFFVFEKNYSLAFGLPFPQVLIYLLISSILLILFFPLLRAYKQKKFFLIISLSLILLGALSNLIDRVRYGYVIDYISLPFLPIFNLGDLMVVVGIGLLLTKIDRCVKLRSNQGKITDTSN